MTREADCADHGARPTTHSDSSMDPSVCNWHPDYSLSSPQAREWEQENEKTRNQPLNIDADGTYAVQHGDCLSTIAARALSNSGEKADQKSIDDEVQAIITLNDHQYPTLDCNRDYVQDGWKLRIPDTADMNDHQPHADSDTGPPRSCDEPQIPNRDVQTEPCPVDNSQCPPAEYSQCPPAQYPPIERYSGYQGYQGYQGYPGYSGYSGYPGYPGFYGYPAIGLGRSIAQGAVSLFATGVMELQQQLRNAQNWRTNCGTPGRLMQGAVEQNGHIHEHNQWQGHGQTHEPMHSQMHGHIHEHRPPQANQHHCSGSPER
ncbi:MAG TPA: hypothetical protein V6C72_19200 [Chroococcales cyanobacterium]